MTPSPPCLTDPRLAALSGVRHAFFTREGGVSTGVYDSLNVGRGSHDDLKAVEENRRRAASLFGLEADALLTCHQVHSALVVSADAAFGQTRPAADGVVVARPGLICGALSADCAPILLADAEARIVAAAHAGWKGALDGMAESVVEAMIARGARRERIVAAVGPCIAQASYEVGLEYLDRFEAGDPGASRWFAPGAHAQKRQFDLPGYVISRLDRAGVADAQWIGCDTCADERFFSNRRAFHRQEGDYGRLLSAIVLV